MVTGSDPSAMQSRSDPAGIAIKLIESDGFVLIDNCNVFRKIKGRFF
jgi:hypothetical protein